MKQVIFLVLFFSLMMLYANAFAFQTSSTITASITVLPSNTAPENTESSLIPAFSSQTRTLDLTSAIISAIYNHGFVPSTYANNVFSGTFEIVFKTGTNFVQSLKFYGI
jgi:hypothetical protein